MSHDDDNTIQLLFACATIANGECLRLATEVVAVANHRPTSGTPRVPLTRLNSSFLMYISLIYIYIYLGDGSNSRGESGGHHSIGSNVELRNSSRSLTLGLAKRMVFPVAVGALDITLDMRTCGASVWQERCER